MKKYIKPELKLISFGADIIQTSGEGGNPIIKAEKPKNTVTVAGVEETADALETKDFSIYQ